MENCVECRAQIEQIRNNYSDMVQRLRDAGDTSALSPVPLLLVVETRHDWFGFAASPRRSFHAGVLRRALNQTAFEGVATRHDDDNKDATPVPSEFVVVQIHTEAHPQQRASRESHTRSAAAPRPHPAMWHRIAGFMASEQLVHLLRRPVRSWMIRDSQVLLRKKPGRRAMTLYRSLDDAKKRMWSQPMILEAMERRARLYEAVTVAHTTSSKPEAQLRRMFLTRSLVDHMQTHRDVALDFIGHVAWHYLTHHSRSLDSLQAPFDLCESLILKARFRHDADMEFSASVVEAMHSLSNGCELITLESPPAEDAPPWHRAWPTRPIAIFKVPFDSPVGIRYLSRSRVAQGPDLQSHTWVDEDQKHDTVTTKSFTVARYILHGGSLYIPEFADVVHELSLLLYPHSKNARVTLGPDLTSNFRRMIFDCYRQLMAWKVATHFVELGVLEAAAAKNHTSALAVRVVPRSVSIPDMYKALPPCMLPDMAATRTLRRDRTRIVGYARGRTPVEVAPRPHSQRLRQYIALSRFTSLTPEQISKHFGHSSRADIRMARDTLRMRQANLSCASMQSCGLCPYHNNFPSGVNGRSPQHMCMDRIRSLQLTSTSSTSTTASLQPQPDAADPAPTDRVVDVKHAVVQGVARLGLA